MSSTPVPRPWPRPRLAAATAWLRRTDLSNRLAVALAGAATLCGLATYVAISGVPDSAPDARTVLILLNLDLILLLLLGVVVARQLTQVFLARRQGSAGSRLHARLVALFSVVAVAPAIAVALFSVVFLHAGLEAWFSERVRVALDNSLNVAEAYLDEHKEVIRADALAMAADLSREGPALADFETMFQRLLEAQAALRSLTEAIVFQSDGQVLARTGLSFLVELEQVPQQALERAADGDVVVLTSDTDDRVRALVRLGGFVDAYLFVGRFVDSRVLNYMARTQSVVDEYRQLEDRRFGIQITFALLFGIVALLLLLAAVWLGMKLANQLVAPIGRLIAAANRIRAGDLTTQVPEGAEPDEIGSLSRAFNRMAQQLASQRHELVDANRQLDVRRRFIEAVLTGVSTCVLGLDARGQITLPNATAAEFFATDPEALTGRPIIDLLPEVAGLVAEVAATPERQAQQQVDILRDGRARTLLVRASAQSDGEAISGFVLTFDDISELLAAQRTAAWAEIARRIAHEIKNPLTPIQLSAERLKRKYLRQITQDPEAFVGCTDTIVAQVDNIGRLINEFSSFARMPAPVFRSESAARLIGQAVLLQQVARPSIRFETELPEHDVTLYCDARQVAQALTNLLQNAVDSILERPAVDGVPPPGHVVVRLADAGETSVVQVVDNGRGLPGGNLERLSDPYVTTREQGTGLGLAIVKKIMEQHGGELILKPRDGGGASVSLVFPGAAAVKAAS